MLTETISVRKDVIVARQSSINQKTVNCFCADVFIKAMPYCMDSHILLIEQSRFCHMSCLSFAFCAILLIYNLPAVLTCTVIDDADDAVHYTSKKTKFN